jgi:EpsI family protein
MTARLLTIFVMMTVAAVFIARAGESAPRPMRDSFAVFPLRLDAWQGRRAPDFDAKTTAMLGVDDYLNRTYSRGTDVAGLYVGFWGSQRQGDTIHSPLNCLPGSGWAPVSHRTLSVPVPDAQAPGGTRAIDVNRYVVEKGADRELVLYWYQSHGRVVANEYLSKVFLVTDAVRLHRTDAALVRVTVHIANDAGGEAQAERSGVAFIGALFPALAGHLPS